MRTRKAGAQKVRTHTCRDTGGTHSHMQGHRRHTLTHAGTEGTHSVTRRNTGGTHSHTWGHRRCALTHAGTVHAAQRSSTLGSVGDSSNGRALEAEVSHRPISSRCILRIYLMPTVASFALSCPRSRTIRLSTHTSQSSGLSSTSVYSNRICSLSTRTSHEITCTANGNTGISHLQVLYTELYLCKQNGHALHACGAQEGTCTANGNTGISHLQVLYTELYLCKQNGHALHACGAQEGTCTTNGNTGISHLQVLYTELYLCKQNGHALHACGAQECPQCRGQIPWISNHSV